MKTKTQHTPTPWTMKADTFHLQVSVGETQLVYLNYPSNDEIEYWKGIVRAVNSHEALLNALKELVYESDGKYFVGINGDTDVTDIVARALAQAEGGK